MAISVASVVERISRQSTSYARTYVSSGNLPTKGAASCATTGWQSHYSLDDPVEITCTDVPVNWKHTVRRNLKICRGFRYVQCTPWCSPWWHQQMETFSALLDLCAGNSPVTGEFSWKRAVTHSLDVFFDLRLNKRFNKQSRRRWFETPSLSLWCHCNDTARFYPYILELLQWNHGNRNAS